MSEVLLWIAKALIVVLVGAVAAAFARLRSLESKRSAADTRLTTLEGRRPPDYSPQLEKIGGQLDGLSSRLAKVETKLESRAVDNLWTEHRDLAKSVSRTKEEVGELKGLISQLSPLVSRLDTYLRSVQGGAKP